MRKRFTKIICASAAVISALALIFAPACKSSWNGADASDSATQAVEGTNGGFLVETENYVYFINGKASNTDSNNFGSVIKGSVQRLAKSDITAHNYTNSVTIVPSVVYSGNTDYNAGLYIYDGYLYYTTPSTQKNTDGEVLNSNLDFKRTKLDGTDTTSGYIWQSSDNAIDYRYVQVDGTVYIIYYVSENLYGTSTNNIHSVNCSTGANTLIAYDVTGYAFDTEDAENPYIYYTMAVPEAMGSDDDFAYNQLYRVRADATSSPREYDYSDVDDYDASSDPVYLNYGDFVFDGIGITRYGNGLTQFNYSYGENKTYSLSNDDYSYSIQWYKNGVLYYTRTEGSDETRLYKLEDTALPDTDGDGRVDSSWDAISKNSEQSVFLSSDYSTEYTFVTLDDGKLYAVNSSSDGVTKTVVENGKLSDRPEENVTMSRDSSSTVLAVRKESDGHTYLYYSKTGGNGYTINRLAIDGTNADYNKLSTSEETDYTYTSIQVLDLDACSDWYMPEFVGNTIFFASETEGVSDYNYIMACDLTGASGMMTNAEINSYNEQYNAIMDKIEEYDEETNDDGTKAYANLSGALKYLFYTRDGDYLESLIQAYVDIKGKDREYLYSEESLQIYKDFAAAAGDWEKDDDGVKYASREVNGETVYSNTRDYYYSFAGKLTSADEEGYIDYFRGSTTYMQTYPVDNSTWWQKLSTGAKVGFVIGMVAAGLVVVGGITVLVIFLVKRHKAKKSGQEEGSRKKVKVDITDDRNVDVYGGEAE